MSKKSRKEVGAIVSGMGVFTSIVSNLTELVKKSGGTMENIYRLATPEGSETLEAIARVIISGAEKAQNQYLELLSGNESLILDAMDGTEILANASDVFAYCHPDLINQSTDKKGKGSATQKTPVQVYEMAKNATFAQMLDSLSSDTRKLCLTQNQIIDFVKKYRNWLRTNGYATLFPFEANNEFFVASVRVRSDGSLSMHVRRFEDSSVWDAVFRSRLVVS